MKGSPTASQQRGAFAGNERAGSASETHESVGSTYRLMIVNRKPERAVHIDSRLSNSGETTVGTGTETRQ